MDAIAFLKAQHRLMEKLFDELGQARDDEERKMIFQKIADNFAAHATIEEEIFYPQAYDEHTKAMLTEAVEEHLSVKRLIADALELAPEDDAYAAKIKVLQEQIHHHVQEEERELFARVEPTLHPEQREVLGMELESLFAKEMQDDPSSKLIEQTDEAAPLP